VFLRKYENKYNEDARLFDRDNIKRSESADEQSYQQAVEDLFGSIANYLEQVIPRHSNVTVLSRVDRAFNCRILRVVVIKITRAVILDLR
jgi:hypothetical protein